MKFAGFWIRLLADILDTALLTIVSWVLELGVMGAVFWVKWLLGQRDLNYFEVFSPFVTQVVNLVLYGLVAAPYYIWGHYRFSTTLGKRPFSIYVVDGEAGRAISLKQSIIRFVAYLPSYLIFAAGFVMAAFHPKKMALHDLLAGTVSVIKKKSKEHF